MTLAYKQGNFIKHRFVGRIPIAYSLHPPSYAGRSKSCVYFTVCRWSLGHSQPPIHRSHLLEHEAEGKTLHRDDLNPMLSQTLCPERL